MPMRQCIFILSFLSPILAAAEANRTWPLWDGKESVESYARRVNLPPTKSIDLGNNVQLDLVLIPAGEFTMGAAKPNIQPPESESVGLAIVGAGVVLLLLLSAGPIARATRKRKRPQFSLGRFVLMIIAASIGVLGGM